MTSKKEKKSIWAKLSGKKDDIPQDNGYERPLVRQEGTETDIKINSEIQEEQKMPAEQNAKTTDQGGWLEDENYEGQLSVDVYQTKNDIIIKSTIAGVRPENLDISIVNDMITVKGTRQKDAGIKKDDYFYQECYWGGFSRSIILPMEVQQNKIEATLEDGILTIKLPKVKKTTAITVKVKRGNNGQDKAQSS